MIDAIVERGTFLGAGRHRRVYTNVSAFPYCILGSDYVIKVPWNGWHHDNRSGLDWGISDNYREHTLSLRYGDKPDENGIVYAYARILPNGWLVMERVDPTWIPREDRPAWADYVDCAQVGRNKKGLIVAYDYATL